MKYLITTFLVSTILFLLGIGLFQAPGMDRATAELLLQDDPARASSLIVGSLPSFPEEPSNSCWAEIAGTHLTLSHVFDGDIETVIRLIGTAPYYSEE